MSPIIATFRSNRDKENILRHASSSKLLRQKGVFVTEDFSNKRVQGRRKTGRKLAQSDVRVYVYTYLSNVFCRLTTAQRMKSCTHFLKKNTQRKVNKNMQRDNKYTYIKVGHILIKKNSRTIK